MQDQYPKPRVNDAAAASTRRQIRRQIALPLALGVVVLTVLIVLLFRGGVGTFSSWADISLIFLLIPLFVLGLLLFAILIVLLVVALGIYGEIPLLSYQILDSLRSVSTSTDRASKAVAKPFFVPSAVRASIKRALHSIRLIFYRP